MRAIFLDRDGVLNRKAPEGSYIARWEELEILSGAVEAVALLAQDGYQIFIVTNQRGLALGRVKQDDLEIMHRKLTARLADAGVSLAGIYFCPHDLADNCKCRKPKPGLLLDAIRQHKLDSQNCWMIGDSPSDVAAGRAAGCHTVLITGTDAPGKDPGADLYAGSLSDAAQQILHSANSMLQN